MYRGERIFDTDSKHLLFEETATTPTALIAFNFAKWYASLENHTATYSDAVVFVFSRLRDRNSLTNVTH